MDEMPEELRETTVIQVSNVAPTATRDQMRTLFTYIGRIEELKLYPDE
jgi:arginine/serine-rich splicing factor 12